LHLPVLFNESLDYLITDPRGVYVDCTLGGGGHFAGIMARTAGEALAVGIDQDAEALVRVRAKVGESDRVILVQGNFRNLRSLLANLSLNAVDGILIDLGVSSFQLDEEERGFSYHHEARLDMRMDSGLDTSAWDLVNRWPEEKLTQIIRNYGEERFAGRIARAIAAARERGPLDTTLQLVEVIRRCVPASYRREGHPARRTFQALRIAVNRELEALEQVLPQGVGLLKPGGRFCIISFHSLEDRMVKDFFAREARSCLCSGKQPVCTCDHKATLKVLTRKPIVPSEEEISTNNRARSAKLRVAEKLKF